MSNKFNFWKRGREEAVYNENVITLNAFFCSFNNFSSLVGQLFPKLCYHNGDMDKSSYYTKLLEVAD